MGDNSIVSVQPSLSPWLKRETETQFYLPMLCFETSFQAFAGLVMSFTPFLSFYCFISAKFSEIYCSKMVLFLVMCDLCFIVIECANETQVH